MIFFLFFPESIFWHFMQIVSSGDNLHEMSKSIFWDKKFKIPSAEYFTCHAKLLRLMSTLALFSVLSSILRDSEWRGGIDLLLNPSYGMYEQHSHRPAL